MFDYIEMFYNRKLKHARNEMLSSVEDERQRKLRTESFQETRGYELTPEIRTPT